MYWYKQGCLYSHRMMSSTTWNIFFNFFHILQAFEIATKFEKEGKYLSSCMKLPCDN